MHNSSYFPRYTKAFPVCFKFSGVPSTCCLNYLLFGLGIGAVFLSHMNAPLSMVLRVGSSSCRRSLPVHPQTPWLTTPPVAGIHTLVISSPLPMVTTHSSWWWALVMTHSFITPNLRKTKLVIGEEEDVCVSDWLLSLTVTIFNHMCLSHLMLLNVRA